MSKIDAVRCDTCEKMGEITALARTPNAVQIPVGWLKVATGPDLFMHDFCSYRCLIEWARTHLYQRETPGVDQAETSGVFARTGLHQVTPWINPIASLVETVAPLANGTISLTDYSIDQPSDTLVDKNN